VVQIDADCRADEKWLEELWLKIKDSDEKIA
jgi:hypothetical protein